MKSEYEKEMDAKMAKFWKLPKSERMKRDWQYAAFIENGGDVIDVPDDEADQVMKDRWKKKKGYPSNSRLSDGIEIVY